MKSKHEALLVTVILVLAIAFSYFFLNPSDYPIVTPSSKYYISGKIAFYSYNNTNGFRFHGNFTLSLFLTEDGELMEIVNMTKGYGKTAMNYVLGEGFQPINRLAGIHDTITAREFVMRYLNLTVKAFPYIWENDSDESGEIWLGV